MPNWCDNELTISGTKEALTILEEKIKTSGELCETIMPTPYELQCLVGNNDKVWVDDKGKWVVSVGDSETMIGNGYTKRDITEEEVVGMKDKYGETNEWDWVVNRRGSKWGVNVDDDMFINDVEDDWLYQVEGEPDWHMSLYYQTAWAPNTGVSEWLLGSTEGINKIEHKYIEEGCDFAGQLTGWVDEHGFDEHDKYQWLHETEDKISYATRLDWDMVNDYEELEVKEMLVYCGEEAIGAVVRDWTEQLDMLPFGLAEIVSFDKHEGVAMISEYEREDYCE